MNRVTQWLQYHFTPHEHNSYRARFLHLDVLTGFLVVAVAFSFYFKQIRASQVLGYATDITVNKLFELTNNERTQAGLQALSYNAKLAQAAQLKAADMFAKNYWAHYAPDGETPWDFILASGYQYEYAGENLAKNFLFSQGVVEAWMNSPSHRENMLRKEYTEVGYAIKNGVLTDEPTTLVVQMFGKPAVAIVPSAEKQVAEQIPALKPVVVPQPVQNPAQQLGLAEQNTQPLVNLFPTVFSINVLFLLVLFVALFLDFFLAVRLNLVHIGGKHIAHMIFVGFILLGLLFITKGAII